MKIKTRNKYENVIWSEYKILKEKIYVIVDIDKMWIKNKIKIKYLNFVQLPFTKDSF